MSMGLIDAIYIISLIFLYIVCVDEILLKYKDKKSDLVCVWGGGGV